AGAHPCRPGEAPPGERAWVGADRPGDREGDGSVCVAGDGAGEGRGEGAMAAPQAAEATQVGQGSTYGQTAARGGDAQRIVAQSVDHGIDMSPNRAVKLRKKLAYRAQRQQEEFDFYAALRILGIQSDPTAREAVYNVEGRS